MTAPLSKEPRKFAPLGNLGGQVGGLPILKGVVFDVDGTLWFVNFLYSICFLFLVSLACFSCLGWPGGLENEFEAV